MKEKNGEIASLAGTAKKRGKAAPWKSIGLGVLVVGLFIAARMLPVARWLTEFNQWVAHLGIWGVVLFIAVYILATVLFFPASVLTIGAGSSSAFS
jgi:uncharacterized membrane protein YdjX (TVP38/TMEM64 family)